jgi:8-oxo-dGTP pyrophosphatase MutT (NUDIX family)
MVTFFKNGVATVLNDTEWQKVLATYPLLKAAGGIVQNPKGDLLMILKRGKWDLPKGTLEPHEELEHCALREVEEECGVSGLQIVDFQAITHHTYVETDGIEYLKQTHWYAMTCDNCSTPQAQTEEDITQAVWATPQQVKENLQNAYGSIVELLTDYYQ